MKIYKKFLKATEYISIKIKDKNLFYFILNTLISIILFLYIYFRFNFINDEIPFWYTKLWGDYQLAPKFNIYLIPLVMLGINLFGLFLVLINKYFIRYFENVIWGCVFFANLFLSASVFRIIRISSIPFDSFINPTYVKLFPSFIFSYLITFTFLPYFIEFAKKKKLITSPQLHSHPGMILKTPSARGGGFVYALIFLVCAIFFVGVSKELTGFLV